MQNNAALKIDHSEEMISTAEIFEISAHEHATIAEQSEAACDMSANKGSCDFELFMQRYSMRTSFLIE